MGFEYMGFLNTWLGHAQIGHGIFDTWFCTAWPAAWPAAWLAARRALCEALVNIYTKGGPQAAPFLWVRREMFYCVVY